MELDVYNRVLKARKTVQVTLPANTPLEYHTPTGTQFYITRDITEFTGDVRFGTLVNIQSSDKQIPTDKLTEPYIQYLVDCSNYRINKRIHQGLLKGLILGASFKDGKYLVGYYRDYGFDNAGRTYNIFLNKANSSDRWIKWAYDPTTALFLLDETSLEPRFFKIDKMFELY